MITTGSRGPRTAAAHQGLAAAPGFRGTRPVRRPRRARRERGGGRDRAARRDRDRSAARTRAARRARHRLAPGAEPGAGRRVDLRRGRVGDGDHGVPVRRRGAVASAAYRQGVRRLARHRPRPGAAPGDRRGVAAVRSAAHQGGPRRGAALHHSRAARIGRMAAAGCCPPPRSPRCGPGSATAPRTRRPASRRSGVRRPGSSTR